MISRKSIEENNKNQKSLESIMHKFIHLLMDGCFLKNLFTKDWLKRVIEES